MVKLTAHPDQDNTADIIKIAILAVGGQGGGVLTNWIIDVAERNGYRAQSTSVAGVAQRTGATIYYVEMCPDTGRQPVFSLSPAQGDVDVLMAAELMEAGRAVMRGFVTPDRTTLIASSHRIAAVSEKTEPGNGVVPSEPVTQAITGAAKHLVSFDMEKLARQAGSVISSSLFGALAGSGALPFARETYEKTIEVSGRGAAASLRAFQASYDVAKNGAKAEAKPHGAEEKPAIKIAGPSALLSKWKSLLQRVETYPEAVQLMAKAGLRKTVDYQDIDYGTQYLDLLEKAIRQDDAAKDYALSVASAKYLANALCYDDMIRVADLKTRSKRHDRVEKEVGAKEGTLLQLTEFFHPRAEEFCSMMPVRIGRFIEQRPKLFSLLDRMINRGRRIRTDSLFGFSQLWMIGSLRRWRRSFLRHETEMQHVHKWYDLALSYTAQDYALAVELIQCRRLIKGYSDTHMRSFSKFDRVLSGLPMLEGREDAADWIRRLRESALKDEKGTALDGALQTIASF